MRFDSMQIGAEDLDEGVRLYRLLLGREGVAHRNGHRFAFERGAIELIPAEPGVRSLRFAREVGDENWPSGSDAYNGIPVLLDGEAATPGPSPSPDIPHAIDHVVVQSPDLERAVALWRDRLGVRLALDR